MVQNSNATGEGLVLMLVGSLKKYKQLRCFFDGLPCRVLGKSCVVFDLDNTLYNELEFLHQVYRNIANAYCDGITAEAFEFLCEDYMSNGRQGLLNRFLDKFSTSVDIENLLTYFRGKKGNVVLNLFPGVVSSLQDIESNAQIFILTNGNKEQQCWKVSLLGLNACFNNNDIIYANDFKPKPSPKAMEHILKISGCLPSDCVFIGDSYVDKECADSSGVEFIQVPHLPLGR